MRRKLNLLDLLRILSSIVIISWLIYFVGIDKILQSLGSFNAFFLVPAIALIFLTILLTALTNWLFIRKFSTVSFKYVFQNYLISWGLGFLLPGKLGEFSLAAFIKDKVSTGITVACLLMQKLIFLFVIVVFGIAGLVSFLGFRLSLAIPTIFIFSLVAFFFFFSTEKGRHILEKIFGKRASDRHGFLDSIHKLSRDARLLLAGLLISVARVFVASAIAGVIFFGFGVAVDFVQLIFITSAATLATLVPFTIGGLGLRESIFVFLAQKLGVSYQVSTSAALVSTATNYFAILIASILSFLLVRPLKSDKNTKKLKSAKHREIKG